MKLQMMRPDDLDADVDDLAPMDEIEYEETDHIETTVEVGLLVARMQATRFAGY